ncbi:Os07g0252200, partial [Oryza sativa Japonica Group]
PEVASVSRIGGTWRRRLVPSGSRRWSSIGACGRGGDPRRWPRRRSTHVAEKEIHVGGRLLEHELCNFLHRRSWRSGGRGEAAKVGDKTSVQLPGMRPT